MKLIRYLLSHALLLAFFLALGFIYYNRAQLFSDDINVRFDNTVQRGIAFVRAFPEQSEPVVQTSESSQVAEFSSTDVEAAQTEPVLSLPVDEAVADTSTAAPTTDADKQQVEITTQTATVTTTENLETESTGELDGQTAEAISQAEPAISETTSIPETVVAQSTETTDSMQAAEQEQVSAVATDKEAAEKSNAELLNQARLAFQSGDTKKSIRLYKELSDLNPDDPNAYGELGNVLYSQGRWQQAGQAYYEAATRLLQQRQIGQVQYLYRVIHGLDRESAEKLRSQMGR